MSHSGILYACSEENLHNSSTSICASYLCSYSLNHDDTYRSYSPTHLHPPTTASFKCVYLATAQAIVRAAKSANLLLEWSFGSVIVWNHTRPTHPKLDHLWQSPHRKMLDLGYPRYHKHHYYRNVDLHNLCSGWAGSDSFGFSKDLK